MGTEYKEDNYFIGRFGIQVQKWCDLRSKRVYKRKVKLVIKKKQKS